jgi:hypothetical protein
MKLEKAIAALEEIAHMPHIDGENKAVTAAQNVLSKIGRLSDWTPTHQPPPDGQRVLVVVGAVGHKTHQIAYRESVPEGEPCFWWFDDNDMISAYGEPHQVPTHWQPLPEPPSYEPHGLHHLRFLNNTVDSGIASDLHVHLADFGIVVEVHCHNANTLAIRGYNDHVEAALPHLPEWLSEADKR